MCDFHTDLSQGCLNRRVLLDLQALLVVKLILQEVFLQNQLVIPLHGEVNDFLLLLFASKRWSLGGEPEENVCGQRDDLGEQCPHCYA